MKPKQEADELIEKYSKHSYGDTEYQVINNAIQCALICAEHILEETKIKKHTMSRSTIQFKWIYSEHWQQVRTILKSRLNNY